MPLAELDRKRIESALTSFCEAVPMHVRDKLRYAFSISGQTVELWEERPRFDDPAHWIRHPIAKIRYNATGRSWLLYCQFRDLKWRSYAPRPTAPAFQDLFDEVKRDPTGIFFG